MIVSWVIGSGGLLGRALTHLLTTQNAIFIPETRFDWSDEVALTQQIGQAVAAFAQAAAGVSRWEIFWAAGIVTFASSPEIMAQETRTLGLLLTAIRNRPSLHTTPGCITLASSAGAIYAGSREFIITEHTAPAPTTAYAREKLLHESMLADLAKDCGRLSVFLARISTIYGGGQTSKKLQGLLTHIARCVIRGEPVHIYVPYDTIRDYIAVVDVARDLMAGSRDAFDSTGVNMKLIASESPTTIAEIIGIFRKIAKRNPRVITSANALSSLYAKRIQFRSVVARNGPAPIRIPLLIGIAQLFNDERQLMKRSRQQTGHANP